MIHPNVDPSEAPKTDPVEIRILVVDDEKPMRMMARVIVESFGFKAFEAASGEEAVTIYQDHFEKGDRIDVVIMDLALPGGMSGLEATRSLLDYDADASVMVSSGYLSPNSRQAAMQQGFAGVLPKPYTIERLSSEIHYILNHRDSIVAK